MMLFGDVRIGQRFFVTDAAAQDMEHDTIMQKITAYQFADTLAWDTDRCKAQLFFTMASLRVLLVDPDEEEQEEEQEAA